MSTDFKLGHPVLAWTRVPQSPEKGFFITTDQEEDYEPYQVLVEKGKGSWEVKWFRHIEIDPEGEPLIGDEVQVSDGVIWKKGILAGKLEAKRGTLYQTKDDDLWWSKCRYPQSGPKVGQTEELPKVITINGIQYKRRGE